MPLQITPKMVHSLLIGVGQIAFFVFLFVVARGIASKVIDRVTRTIAAKETASGDATGAARAQTLGSLIKSVTYYTLAFVLAVTALGVLGVNLAGVLGTAGVAGVAVGFGAQKLVRDVITGFFILLEDQYAVGDYVTIGAVSGTVVELGMRITRIRDDEGRLYILSNGDISQVCNQSRGPVTGTLEVAIAASADVARAESVLQAAFATAVKELEMATTPEVRGISAADATKTVLRVVFQAEGPRRPAELALELREVARRALLEAGIPLA